jgi:hypothetical protein
MLAAPAGEIGSGIPASVARRSAPALGVAGAFRRVGIVIRGPGLATVASTKSCPKFAAKWDPEFARINPELIASWATPYTPCEILSAEPREANSGFHV